MSSTRLNSLNAIEQASWAELERAVHDRAHPWRVAVLATAAREAPAEALPAIGGGAEEPASPDAESSVGVDARCVLLREVDREARAVVFFADARSPKVRQIGRARDGVLVLWSSALSWQLRLGVSLEVATSGLAVSSRWARLKMTPAAQDYLSPLPPGSQLAAQEGHPPPPERSTREHFCVVSAQVHRLDWTELHAEGHRRALFDATGARWVVP